jgi:hypothetical protein
METKEEKSISNIEKKKFFFVFGNVLTVIGYLFLISWLVITFCIFEGC